MRGDTGQFRVRSTTLVGFPMPTNEPHPGRARRTTIVDVVLEMHFHSDLHFVREYAANMSSGGIFVPTHRRPMFDSEVLLSVKIPNGDVLQSPARVVRVVEQPPPGGVCLSFSRREPAFEAALHAYFLGLAGRRS